METRNLASFLLLGCGGPDTARKVLKRHLCWAVVAQTCQPSVHRLMLRAGGGEGKSREQGMRVKDSDAP